VNDKNNLISLFQEQIFGHKLFRNNCLTDDDEAKVIINDRATILLENIILPIISLKDIDNEEKEEEYNILLKNIKNMFLSVTNLDKIFEIQSIKKVFDSKNVKIMSDIIYSLLLSMNKEDKNIKVQFNRIYKLIKDSGHLFYICDEDNDNKEKKTSLEYLIELIYKLLQLDTDLVEYLINQEGISNLLEKIKIIKNSQVRAIVFDILILLLDNCNFYSNEKGTINVDSDEKERIMDKICENSKILKRLFNEKDVILIKIIKLLQYENRNYSEKFNKAVVGDLYNLAMKGKNLKKMMDLLYEIINIKDNYILNRLYVIMGFPEMLINQQIKEDKYENIIEIDSDDNEEE
jgi:hypothetical protein